MLILIVGILLFLGSHTLTTLRETRSSLVMRMGEGGYKGLYSVAALAGLVLIAWGFARYRDAGMITIWSPPEGMRHLTILLMWFAFVSLAASGRRPGRIRGWLRHPMLVAVKIWALAHLLVNGDLGGMLLFGSFLAWAVWDRIAVKRRGDAGAARVAGFTRSDAVVVVVGSIAFVAMIFAHPYLIGVPVIAM